MNTAKNRTEDFIYVMCLAASKICRFFSSMDPLIISVMACR